MALIVELMSTWTLDWTEAFGFITGLACVYLVVRENPWNWPLAMVNAVFFLVLFWRTHLFADSMLQVVYFCIGGYGWWNWLFGGENHSALSVSRTGARLLSVYLFACMLLTAAIYGVLVHTPSTVPFWDALTTSMSFVAQVMLTRKLIENWYLWILADVIYIGLYGYKGLILTSILYVVFLGLCILGLRQWREGLDSNSS